HQGVGGLFSQATPAPSPTPTPAPFVVFQDSLLSNDNGWYVGTNCYFRADGYHIKGDWACYAARSEYDDATIRVDVRRVAGTPDVPYGMTFRLATDSTNKVSGYIFAIDGLGYWIFYKSVDGASSLIVDYTTSSAIRTTSGAVNTLRVRSVGSQFVFSINGIQVGIANDTAFSRGSTGLAVIGNLRRSSRISPLRFEALVVVPSADGGQ
ncbi:MAG TPA: hypothetical protein VGS80_24710, partial [Ktedonobacterales bacterium]|nr:hypothetical protein [Ktedonobacterales bacterium]